MIPLLLIVYYGLTSAEGGFTLDNIAQMGRPENLKALWLALVLSVVSTLICLVMAYPLAMILSNMKFNANSFIVMIFIIPMWMNFLLRTLAWQTLLEKNGVINMALKFLHLPTLNIINTPYAIVLGMVYNFLPFMLLPIYNVLIKIDKNVVNAARDLGANSFQTFCKITFPLSLPGVISGITMVFVPSLTTFVISDLLGGSKILLIGNVIEQKFKQGNNWNVGSGLSLVLMVFILISMAIMQKYDKDGEGGCILMKKIIQRIYLIFIFVLLYAPILTLVVLSFNNSRTRAKWGGFTTKWYVSMFENSAIMDALYNTLLVGVLSAFIATLLGLTAAISINKMRRRSRTLVLGVINIPMLNAEIVTGISLMLVFIAVGNFLTQFGYTIQFGFWTVLAGHVTFNLPYVVMSILPKLKQVNMSTYEAALDLGASPMRAFFYRDSAGYYAGSSLRFSSGFHSVPG